MLIYQIEISNRCNLTCSYCPHPNQDREQGLMSWPTFEKSIELLIHCGQRTAYLHNFGEPLLHPDLVEFVRHCSTRGVSASFFTNGVLLGHDALRRLADAGLRFLCLSEHTKGEFNKVRTLVEDGGYPIEIRDTFRPERRTLHSWAGQVRARHADDDGDGITLGPCIFQRHDAAVVLWDGRINVCCIDADGKQTRGTVEDFLVDPSRYRFQPIPLCGTCSLMRGEEDLS